MDYTKIIERAREIYANPKEALKDNVVISNEGTAAAIKVALLELFSKEELAESEDERIRKELIDFVNHYRNNTDLTTEQAEWTKKAIAYLEKQKDSNPSTPIEQEQPHFVDASKMEQPEVDLREIIEQTYHDGSVADTSDMDHVDYENIALYFYELGLNARKEGK